MTQESIELAFLFKGPPINTHSIIEYFGSIHESLYKSNFHEISYSTPIKNTFKGKSLKFTDKNIGKLIDENPANGFDLFSLLPDWEYKSKDINFLIGYTPDFNDEKGAVSITINKEFFYKEFNNKKLVEIYLSVANYLNENKAKIKYGFIFLMDNQKFPGLFVTGIGNYNLSKNEQKELRIWADRNLESDSKIWRVFWGNLITKKHLKAGFSLDRIKTIVGANNFFMVDNDVCFFNLPNDDLLYGNEHKSSEKELLKLLNSLT
jgi:hypothetical protein